MELKDLREKVISTIESCYMVEKGSVYELKVTVYKQGEKSEKDVSEIQTNEGEDAFFLGFDNPGNKEIWKPDYAQPVIVVIGIEDNGKLKLSNFSKGGFDVPNAWFTTKGDFFLSKEEADSFISGSKPEKQPEKTKNDIIKSLKEIIKFAHNFVDSEAADEFDERITAVIEDIKKMK